MVGPMKSDFRTQRTQKLRRSRERENQEWFSEFFCVLCETFAPSASGSPPSPGAHP
jgi:hypothetical protein